MLVFTNHYFQSKNKLGISLKKMIKVILTGIAFDYITREVSKKYTLFFNQVWSTENELPNFN